MNNSNDDNLLETSSLLDTSTVSSSTENSPPATARERNKESVRVVCRFRPSNTQEVENGGNVCITCDTKSVQIQMPKSVQPYAFEYDHVCDQNATQQQVFEIIQDDIINGMQSIFC